WENRHPSRPPEPPPERVFPPETGRGVALSITDAAGECQKKVSEQREPQNRSPQRRQGRALPALRARGTEADRACYCPLSLPSFASLALRSAYSFRSFSGLSLKASRQPVQQT